MSNIRESDIQEPAEVSVSADVVASTLSASAPADGMFLTLLSVQCNA